MVERQRQSQPFCYCATVTETWKCQHSLAERVYSAGNSREERKWSERVQGEGRESRR